MSRVIFKYAVPVSDTFTLSMPRGSQILSAQLQEGRPQIWALVSPLEVESERHFAIFGTGNPVPDAYECDLKFIASIQMNSLVWHLFEVVGDYR